MKKNPKPDVEQGDPSIRGRYYVAEASDSTSLEEQVDLCLDSGYHLHGPMQVMQDGDNGFVFFQAMVMP